MLDIDDEIGYKQCPFEKVAENNKYPEMSPVDVLELMENMVV